MRILITNDDGVDAPGIAAIARSIAQWCASATAAQPREAMVVAPLTNYSGMSAAVTDIFDNPHVTYQRTSIEGAPSLPTYALDAPPALCAVIGALGTFGWVPDLVVSGINAGANVGRSILHSGTVGAVMSAGQLGVSGLAISVQWGDDVHYETAATIALQVLDEISRAPARTLFNLNVPNVPIDQVRGVRRGRISSAEVVAAAGPFAGGEPIGQAGVLPLLMGAASPTIGNTAGEESDDDAFLVESGFASLTPIMGPHENTDPALDSTMHTALALMNHHLEVRRG